MADPGIYKPGARSRRGIIFEVLRLFWCPFTHTLFFCSESIEEYTYFYRCMLITIKFMLSKF